MSTPAAPPPVTPPITPPAGTPPPDANAPKLFKDIVPAELHERGWAKPFLDKPWSPELGVELSKKLDGAETLIGKKTLIPSADAKPEEIDAFLGKLRPEKPEDYEFKLGEKPDEGFVKAFRESAHFAGLSKVQTARLVEKLTPHFQASAKAKSDAEAAREAEYAKVLGEMTGGADFSKKQARVMNAARELVPKEARAFVDKMDDKSLALFAVFADAVLSKYAGEDDFKADGPAGGGGGEDKAALTAELHKLYASDGWVKGFQHPDHEKTVKRVNEILAHQALK